MTYADMFVQVILFYFCSFIFLDDCNTLNSIKKLALFVDNDGLIKFGSRLQKSSFDLNVRHPILLPLVILL